MGKKLFFYSKYAVNVRFASILSFMSSVATDGPVIWVGYYPSSSIILVCLKHFRKFIFSKWLVLKSHACAIGSISGLLISTINGQRRISRSSSPAHLFTSLTLWYRRWSCWNIVSTFRYVLGTRQGTIFHDFGVIISILRLATICSLKNSVSFRTAPDCEIALLKGKNAQKVVCRHLFCYRSWSATQ